ncbi:MAG: DUF262 domain-containing protein [Methanomicrobiales archaeon]
MAEYTIRELNEKILSGQIRIPAFQRGFIWEGDRIAYLMDSIYKGYPVGTLLFWRTKQPLSTEKQIGPFNLIDRDPDYPIDYVLDGQQRITSLFGVFQTILRPATDSSENQKFSIYYDFTEDPVMQDTQFYSCSEEQFDNSKHFPLKYLFDTVAYRLATKDFTDDLAKKIDTLQSIFKETRIPIDILETEDKTKVAIVFERINTRGVPLDTFQLLSAWTWSEEFDLKTKFGELKGDLKPFGFKEVGDDENLLLRCISAILQNEVSVKTVMDLNGAIVRDRFQEITNGIKGSIDFIRTQFNLSKQDNLPFNSILIPLSVFFSIENGRQITCTAAQVTQIKKWFWKTCFSKRYSAGVLRNLNRDIEEIIKLKNGEESALERFSVNINREFFIDNSFKLGTVNTNSFILMLAQLNPLNFISGLPINIGEVLKEYNKNEFHHIFPKNCLKEQTISSSPDCLANICFMSKNDNNRLGGECPRNYREKMPDNIDRMLRSALIPPSVFTDSFDEFVNKRSELLFTYASSLMST